MQLFLTQQLIEYPSWRQLPAHHLCVKGSRDVFCWERAVKYSLGAYSKIVRIENRAFLKSSLAYEY